MSSLNAFFNPRSIAVVGASPKPGSVGYVIIDRLKKSFKGRIYPVNPNYEEILGLRCYRSIKELPETVDLVVVAVRAEIAVNVVEEAAALGVKAAIVISGGFAEIGGEGEARQKKLEEIVERYGIRLIGPNCLGIYDAYSGVDTFFLPDDRLVRPPAGHISIISQSGAMLSMWLDWMAMRGLGVAKAVSYGNKVDVDDVDMLNYLAEDEKTKVIIVYIEGLKPGRGSAFIEAVRRAISNGKPVIVLKGGRTERGFKAAASHTAALASGYEIYRSALKQAGAIEVENMEQMFDVAKAFLYFGYAEGRRLLIITNAGGEGVLATDYASVYGLEVPPTPNSVKERFRKIFPPHVVLENPIDLTGDTDDERYRAVLEVAGEERIADIILLIAPPHPPAIKGTLVEYAADFYRKYKIPVLAVVTGGRIAEEFASKFESKGIPAYPTPERAAFAAAALARFGEVLRRISM